MLYLIIFYYPLYFHWKVKPDLNGLKPFPGNKIHCRQTVNLYSILFLHCIFFLLSFQYLQKRVPIVV